MEPNQIHHTIAAQIDNVLPDDYEAGVDVKMQPIDRLTLRVLVKRPTPGLFDVAYDEGADTYVLTRYSYIDSRVQAGKTISDVYCDQLGELIFGDDAKPFTLPMVMISGDDGETWEQVA